MSTNGDPPPPDERGPLPPPPAPHDPFALQNKLRTPMPGPRLRRAALRSAAFAMVASSAVWLQNLFDPPPLRSGWVAIVVLLFPFVFFAFAIAILVLSSWQQRGFWVVVGSPTPWWSIAWRVVAAVALMGLFALSFPARASGPSGQPVAEGSTFYVSNHGVRTEITEEQYVDISRSWSRGFSAAPITFAGIAVLVLTAPWVRNPRPDRT